MRRLTWLALTVGSLAAAYPPLCFALLLFLIGAQQPDPTIADGDPCCGHPDTWGQVAEAIAAGCHCLLAAAGPLTLAIAELAATGLGRLPRWASGRGVRVFAIVWLIALAEIVGVLSTGG